MQIEHVQYCIATLISRLTRRVVEIRQLTPVEGGYTQPSFVATLADGGRFFVKVATPEQRERLRAEARGLQALRVEGAPRVPQTWMVGGEARYYFLLLEHLELHPGDSAAYARLGREVAAMHKHSAEDYGFEKDNFIGATPQSNHKHGEWPAFWREERLLPQLKLAARESSSKAWLAQGERLAASVESFFTGYQPRPALLHGDLWPGNAGFLADGTPVIFDPAAYYGDREADLAMSEMFGGLPDSFFAGYNEAWPLDAGYGTRKGLYKLYHLLNHYNMFGEKYAGAVSEQIDALLAGIK